MEIKKNFVCGFFAVIFALAFIACRDPASVLPELTSQTGAITGRVTIAGTQTGIGGVVITLESSNGTFSASVINANQSIVNGARSISGARSVVESTTTTADGSFTLSNIPAGNYILT